MPAYAAVADFTGTLTLFVSAGSGEFGSGSAVLGSASGVGFASSGGSFTIPSSLFVTNRTTPIGFTSNAVPNSIYTIRTVTNRSNASGAFSGTSGTGPYGGVMSAGMLLTVELGVVPLPNVFGSLLLPVNVGSPGTSTAVAAIGANLVTISVVGTGWTTGLISISDQTIAAPSATTATSGTAVGTNNLTANGGSITLVTPFLVRIRSAANDNRAGYAVLTLNFSNKVPEPSVLALLGSGVAGLLIRGVRRS